MRSAYRNCLVDTNVLLYPDDPSEPERGARALAVLRAISEAKVGCVSPQILGELFVGLQRLRPPLPHPEIMQRMRYYVQFWKVCSVNSDTVMEAVRGVAEHQFHYYDALIWATARENRLPLVLSEDCHDERTIEGVIFRNPLIDGFDLDTLL